MKKYLYIVSTVKTVEQTWEYEFESDEKLTKEEATDYIFNTKNDVEGFHNDLLDEVRYEEVLDFHDHEIKPEEKP
jgi:hypothetical protein